MDLNEGTSTRYLRVPIGGGRDAVRFRVTRGKRSWILQAEGSLGGLVRGS